MRRIGGSTDKPIYSAECRWQPDDRIREGIGSSKLEAKQAAARVALCGLLSRTRSPAFFDGVPNSAIFFEDKRPAEAVCGFGASSDNKPSDGYSSENSSSDCISETSSEGYISEDASDGRNSENLSDGQISQASSDGVISDDSWAGILPPLELDFMLDGRAQDSSTPAKTSKTNERTAPVVSEKLPQTSSKVACDKQLAELEKVCPLTPLQSDVSELATPVSQDIPSFDFFDSIDEILGVAQELAKSTEGSSDGALTKPSTGLSGDSGNDQDHPTSSAKSTAGSPPDPTKKRNVEASKPSGQKRTLPLDTRQSPRAAPSAPTRGAEKRAQPNQLPSKRPRLTKECEVSKNPAPSEAGLRSTADRDKSKAKQLEPERAERQKGEVERDSKQTNSAMRASTPKPSNTRVAAPSKAGASASAVRPNNPSLREATPPDKTASEHRKAPTKSTAINSSPEECTSLDDIKVPRNASFPKLRSKPAPAFNNAGSHNSANTNMARDRQTNSQMRSPRTPDHLIHVQNQTFDGGFANTSVNGARTANAVGGSMTSSGVNGPRSSTPRPREGSVRGKASWVRRLWPGGSSSTTNLTVILYINIDEVDTLDAVRKLAGTPVANNLDLQVRAFGPFRNVPLEVDTMVPEWVDVTRIPFCSSPYAVSLSLAFAAGRDAAVLERVGTGAVVIASDNSDIACLVKPGLVSVCTSWGLRNHLENLHGLRQAATSPAHTSPRGVFPREQFQ